MKRQILLLMSVLLSLSFSGAQALAQDIEDVSFSDIANSIADNLSEEQALTPLPMPSAVQTDIVPDVSLPASVPSGEVLASPDSNTSVSDDPENIDSVLNDRGNASSNKANVYFDSVSRDREIRDEDIPRRVDPRFEPGSRYIVVERGARADSHQAKIVAAKRALSLGRYSSALELYEELYRTNKRDQSVLMGLAVAQQKSGFVESAIATYEELLEINPDNVDAQINMLGLIKQQYPSIAYRRLVNLWEKEPRNPGIAAQIGLISAELGNIDDALHYLGIATSLEPNNANHMYNMAVIVDQSGNQEEAIRYYERALEIDAAYGGGRTIPRDYVYDRLSILRSL